MDKRPKILVVEDQESARDTMEALLEREGMRTEGCGSLSAALAAIDAMRFDVALVDIMLAGPQDRSNRDGLEVLRRIQAANEGTKALVLSGQDDPVLSADILQEHGAYAYIGKSGERTKAPNYLSDKINEALKASVAPREGRDWSALIRALAPGAAEQSLVHDILRLSSFSGGLPVLRDSLLGAGKWLAPLLPPADGRSFAADSDLPGVFAGLFWSRGQGRAVQIIVHGSNVDPAEVDRHFGTETHDQMHRRTKGGLTILVLGRSDLTRASFAGS
jgi:CheY-like chemotaxis protein